ncbi:hypothetical protein FRC11_014527 [Ceratobasidium sp. 423]|nr:hypothetical protein FRC11_014527 [Ceratobasidium sp. 423]
MATTGPVHINSLEKFVEAINGNQDKPIAIVDFWADWCGPCGMIAGPYANHAEENKNTNIGFYKLNIEEQPWISGWDSSHPDNKLSIRTIPLFIAFRDGKELDRFSGAQQNKLSDFIKEVKVKGLKGPAES